MSQLLFIAFCLALAVFGSRFSLIKFEEYYLDPDHAFRAFAAAFAAQIAAIILGAIGLILAGVEVARAIYG